MKVERGFENDNGNKITETMPDIVWDLHCVVDRYFHRDKYDSNEKVNAVIKRIVKRLKKTCVNETQKRELNNFLIYIKKAAKKVPMPHRYDIEKQILQEIYEKY